MIIIQLDSKQLSNIVQSAVKKALKEAPQQSIASKQEKTSNKATSFKKKEVLANG